MVKPKVPYHKDVLNVAPLHCLSTTITNFKSVLSWKQLAIPLQTVLPNDPKYTYVIEDFQPKSNEEFEGAPMHCFEAAIRLKSMKRKQNNGYRI